MRYSIGVGIVELSEARQEARLKVMELDTPEATPLIDINPRFSEVDRNPNATVGWRK